jgi:hypothetical protein
MHSDSSAPFTEAETRYLYSYKPAGFLRAWEAMYGDKCISGPWTISKRRRIFGGFERGNRAPRLKVTHFPNEPRLHGWEVALPMGFGTLAVWGYWVDRSAA